MTFKKTLHVGYRGGSGGFLLLHLLMLSTQYCVRFSNEESDFKKIIDHQWNISNPNLWKSSEFWPNKFHTVTAGIDLNKILYFCNPTKEEFFNYELDVFKSLNTSYNNIKDCSWPNITCFDDFKNLSADIQTELLEHPDVAAMVNYIESPKKFIWLYADINSQNELAFYKKAYWYYQKPNVDKITDLSKLSGVWNDTLVDRKAIEFLNKSDLQIKLQDLVNDSEILIKHELVNKITQEQLKLLTHWKSLHPPELLRLIGINTSI